MTTTQKLLANLKRDIDTLSNMGNEFVRFHYKSYQNFTNDERPSHYKIIRDRTYVLQRMINHVSSNKDFSTREIYKYLLDSYISIIQDYYSFTLSLNFNDDAELVNGFHEDLEFKVRSSIKLKRHVELLGNDMLKALSNCPGSNYHTYKIETLLKLF